MKGLLKMIQYILLIWRSVRREDIQKPHAAPESAMVCTSDAYSFNLSTPDIGFPHVLIPSARRLKVDPASQQ